MSKTIDERVVEMRFDNKHFESNVQTSMSTLDKLKQKLNLTGASKGLDDLGSAAKRVDLSSVGNSAETVGLKFNAMYTIADQALRNMTTAAMNAGTKIIKALTLDPITTGFQEYETQINAVQTILANTQSKGSTLDDVNVALDELNKYADKTIYNFTEMTRNIGTFTAAGVDLDTSVNAIQGIANLAAISGSNSQQASTAMYQLSQALAAGTVKLMDWNSVVNAGMGGQVFQDALKETARAHGIAIDEMIADQGSFRETLKEGWITSEVLTETLQKFTLTTEGLTEEQIEANREMLRAKGYTEDQIDEIFKLGETATDAATKVKTFTQLWDVLKEAAQSGWTQTWEIIMGDFEEAKALFTPLSDFFTGIINKISDWRNAILETALAKGILDMNEKLKKAFDKVRDALDPVADAIDTVKGALVDYDELVNQIIRGEWKNAPTRWQDLAAAGYDWAHAQNLVNERLGSSVRHATNYKEAADGATKSTEDAAGATSDLTEEQTKLLKELFKMSDAQLLENGYTKEQIENIRELQRELEKLSAKLGLSIDDLLDNINNINGRWLIINAFKTIGQSLVTIFKSIGEAWNDAFGMSTDEIGNKLFNVIAAFHRFSQSLKINKETADNLTRTLKGVFAILDLLLMFIGGPIKVAFKVTFKLLSKILGMFHLDILDVTAAIGDVIVKFRNWVEDNNIVMQCLEKLISIIANLVIAFWELEPVQKAFKTIKDTIVSISTVVSERLNSWLDLINTLTQGVRDGSISIGEAFSDIGSAAKEAFLNVPLIKKIYDFIKAFMALPEIRGYIEKFRKTLSDLRSAITDTFGGGFKHLKKTLSEAKTIGKNLIDGLWEGLQNGTIKIKDAVIQIGKFILDTLKKILGIHSPSTETKKIGGNIIDGLVLGLKNGISSLWDIIKKITSTIVNAIKSIDFGALLAAGIGVGMIFAANKFGNILSLFAAPLEGLGDLFGGAADLLVGVGKMAKAYAANLRADALFTTAKAILVLVGAIALLTLLDQDKLWNAVFVLTVLSGVLIGFSLALGRLSGIGSTVVSSAGILAIAASILILAIALKQMSAIAGEDVPKLLATLTGIVVGIGAVFFAFGKLIKNPAVAANMGQAGIMFLKMSIALLILVTAIKKIAGISTGDIIKGLAVITYVELLFAGLITVSYFAGAHASKAGGMLLKMSIALLIMVTVIKQISDLEIGDIVKGLAVISAIELMFAGIIAVSMFAGAHAAKAGGMLLMMAIALSVIVIVIKQITGLSNEEIKRGLSIIGLIGLVFVALIAVSNIAGANALKAGGMLLMMSGALLILTGVIFILSKLDPSGLGRAVAAIAVLELCFAGLIAVTKLAQGNIKTTLITLMVAIGLLVAAVAALTLLDQQKLMTATASLSLLTGVFALLIYSTSFLKAGAKTWKRNLGTIATLTLIVAAMAGIVVLLSKCNPSSAISSAAALSMLLISLATSFNIISMSKSMTTKKMTNTLIMLGAMTGAIALLGLILSMMSALNVSNALPNAVALSVLLLAVSGSIAILSLIGPMTTNSLMGVVALLAMAVPLAAFVGVLALMQNVQNAMNNVLALTTLMTAMTLLLIPLSLIGILIGASGGMVLLGVAGLLAMAVPMLAFVGVLAVMQNIQGATTNAMLLIALMNTMSDILIKVSLLGPLALIGVTALAGLTTLMVGLGALATAVGALMDKYPSLETFMDKGIPILVKLANGLGQIIGAFVGGMIEGVAASLPILGLCLSQFIMNAMPFINGVKMVDESVLTGIGILTGAILALTAADLLTGVTTFLTGGSSFAQLGTELSNFYNNALPFINGVSGLDPAVMEGVKNLASAILVLTGANMLETITSWLGGDASLGDFGAQLGQLGSDLNVFVTNLGTFTEDQVTTVNCAGKAIKALADAASSIPNEGGLWGLICGENSLATFSSKLPQLGTDLKGFVTNLGTFTEDQVTTVNCAGEAIKALASAAKEIPNEGGLWALICGDNSLATFSSKLPQLGTDLKGFITNLGTFDDASIATVDCAGKAIKALADAANKIPNEGGFWAKIVGDNSLATFGSKLPGLATNIKSFVTNLGTFGEEQIATVNSAVKVIKAIAKLGEIDISDTSDGLSSLGKKLEGFAKKLVSFVSKMDEVGSDSISSAVSKTKDLIDLAKTAASTNVESLSTFGTSLKKVATEGIKGFVKAFTGEDPKAKVKKAAEAMMKTFVKGMGDKKDSVKKKAEEVAKAAAGKLKSETITSKAKSAGKALVNGFADGITEQTWKAEAKAKAMANAAEKAAKEALDINSPSKVFRALGYSVPEGFAMGIDKLSSMATGSATSMADMAINGVKDSIARISEYINSDIDSQPTIRPVLDLSDVRAGAGAINGLFATPSVGVMSNVQSISSMMSNRQNGRNTDVVSAIDKLRKDLGNVSGPSYVINGVNYSDDAGVAEAFETITRAARIERRI